MLALSIDTAIVLHGRPSMMLGAGQARSVSDFMTLMDGYCRNQASSEAGRS
jgi:hypothetical protein